ncbi:MAG: DUF1622 domain-containing protein [Candidatus Babeliales bacterium]|nr:DUF1622 domain-containing protein [Candidatus Babeliales bacterium]
MLLSDVFLLYIKDFLEFIGVVVIAFGAGRSVYQLLLGMLYKKFSANYIRLQFGHSVTLGLEFMVAGDIIGSLVKPNYYNLGLLAIIVLIRTVLSYFLNQELEALTPEQRHSFK